MLLRCKFLHAASALVIPGLASATGLDLSYYSFDLNNPYSLNVNRTWSTIPIGKKAFSENAPYALPASALLIVTSKNDSLGAVQLARGCGATLLASYALQSLFSLPDSSSLSPRNTASMCSAAFLQYRYGSSYGIPAISLAASLDGKNIASIPQQIGNALMPTLLSFFISDHFTDRAGDDGGGVSIAPNGIMRFNAPAGTPLLRLNLGSDSSTANKPGSNTFIQIDKNRDGRTRFMLGWQAKF